MAKREQGQRLAINLLCNLIRHFGMSLEKRPFIATLEVKAERGGEPFRGAIDTFPSDAFFRRQIRDFHLFEIGRLKPKT